MLRPGNGSNCENGGQNRQNLPTLWQTLPTWIFPAKLRQWQSCPRLPMFRAEHNRFAQFSCFDIWPGGAVMTDLTKKRCVSCEVGAVPLTAEQVKNLAPAVPDWKVSADGKRIRREWRVRDFVTALDFFQRIAQIAETEDHHPDLHLVGYRNVAIEIWTHAVGGLTENDFILAAKIDQLPVALKT
jgi:4a-hydroxytetrahydrobiopterin dehydratase